VSVRPTDFVLPVDKPVGPTSHDVVAAARKALGERRVGHTGTLDPFASGLLLLCVGRATRLAEYFSGLDKAYDAEARLGVATDTLDCEGEVVSESDAWTDLTEAALEEALGALRGEIQQVPPQFSAKKVDGERAYKTARDGRRVELPPVAVTVHELTLTGVDLPLVRFRVRCSSGTYVRALARDLGDALGVGAHLTALRRTAVGAWRVASALSMDDLADPVRVAAAAVDPLEALAHLPIVEVDGEAAGRLAHGQTVEIPGAGHAASGAGVIAVAHDGALVAVGEADERVIRPRKVFAA
jgi:tRNA pseudouridine55 synthase